MTDDYKQGLLDAVDFIFSHYETYKTDDKENLFNITPKPKFLPKSQEHLDARIARWKELIVKDID